MCIKGRGGAGGIVLLSAFFGLFVATVVALVSLDSLQAIALS